MKITTHELEYMTNACYRAAKERGIADILKMPIEWRPIAGIRLLTDLANGDAIWPGGDFKHAANKFITAYGAYYDMRNKIKYTAAAMQALRTMTR